LNGHARPLAVPRRRAPDQALANQPCLGGADLGLADIPAGTALFRLFGPEIERPPVPNVEAWFARLQERPASCEHVMAPFDGLKGKLDHQRMAMTDLRICFVGDSFVNGTGYDEALMRALSAKRTNKAMADFVRRMAEAGKAPKIILVAVARKLLFYAHAVVRTRNPFQPFHKATFATASQAGALTRSCRTLEAGAT
jgi:hypothetical protein